MLHIEGVGKERRYAVTDIEHMILPAKFPDHLGVIEDTCRCLINVHKKACKALSVILVEVFFCQLLPGFQFNNGMRNLVNFAEFHEAVAEASAIDDQDPICLVKTVHDDRFHRTCRRVCHEGNS